MRTRRMQAGVVRALARPNMKFHYRALFWLILTTAFLLGLLGVR